jgi:hypothetical protein
VAPLTSLLPEEEARLATAVIGAGPAGLLFCLVGRLLHERRRHDAAAWSLRLFDKRERYARTHRLRIGPEPYLAIQRDVSDPRFDAVIDFLAAHDFRPEVNVLEDKLEELLGGLGVRKELLAIGDGPGEESLAGLRRRLEAERALGLAELFTIVAADSVHSAVRERVRGSIVPTHHVHQQVARLRVVGPGLPERLGPVAQVRLSKVLGSLLDYRLNVNGFAEVDLFLSQGEHLAVRHLDATPKTPLVLRPSALSALRAPLFRRIVEHMGAGFGEGPCEVQLQSTFELEHTVMPRLVFDRPELGATVFLVGDAAVSLPFFRGMACLAACVHSLAQAHCDLAVLARTDLPPPAQRQRQAELAERYEAEARGVKERELATVEARARLVAVVRELTRVSALVPFPVQSRFLSAPDREAPSEGSRRGVFLNAALALTAALLALGGPALALRGIPHAGWLAVAALPVQGAGGVAYHAVHTLEHGSHALVRTAWRAQTVLLFILGLPLSILAARLASGWLGVFAASAWLVLAAMFVVGLYVYERLVIRWLARAKLEVHDAGTP